MNLTLVDLAATVTVDGLRHDLIIAALALAGYIAFIEGLSIAIVALRAYLCRRFGVDPDDLFDDED